MSIATTEKKETEKNKFNLPQALCPKSPLDHPSGQTLHVVDLTTSLNWPAWHNLQSTCCFWSVYLPGMQLMHTGDWILFWYLPIGQSMQIFLCSFFWLFPTGQILHSISVVYVWLASSKRFPATQNEHSVAPLVGVVLPAGQFLHVNDSDPRAKEF